jgi:hypothetical protein
MNGAPAVLQEVTRELAARRFAEAQHASEADHIRGLKIGGGHLQIFGRPQQIVFREINPTPARTAFGASGLAGKAHRATSL